MYKSWETHYLHKISIFHNHFQNLLDLLVFYESICLVAKEKTYIHYPNNTYCLPKMLHAYSLRVVRTYRPKFLPTILPLFVCCWFIFYFLLIVYLVLLFSVYYVIFSLSLSPIHIHTHLFRCTESHPILYVIPPHPHVLCLSPRSWRTSWSL